MKSLVFVLWIIVIIATPLALQAKNLPPVHPVKMTASVTMPAIPTVSAGEDIKGFAGIPVVLHPTAIPAVPGDKLKYHWKVINKPHGSRATLTDRHGMNPGFLANLPGYYELQLQVTEGKTDVNDIVAVHVRPNPKSNPPVAVPTAPSNIVMGQQVTLNGSGSYDPSGLVLRYDWRIASRPQGSMATLANAMTALPSLTPDLPGRYEITLTVSNEYATGISQAVVIQVRSNVAPVAEAGQDQTVDAGATVTLDGSASRDADGDPLTYSWAFQSCPQGVCPSLNSSATAKPSFVAGSPGTYVLSLTVRDLGYLTSVDTVKVTAAIVGPDPNFMKLQWQYGIFGTGIGQAGIHLADLDGDGAVEIIASASTGGFAQNTMWYILRRNAAGGYEQIWRSGSYSATIVRLLVTDINNDGKKEIIVGFSDGTIRIFDGTTHDELKKIQTTSSLKDMAMADLNGDGKQEIVTTNGTGVFVYGVDTGTLNWSLSSGGGTSMAIGNVDGDSSLEIVTTTSGGKGYVIDAASHAIQWEYANSFGYRVSLGDLDGDGMDEIVAAAAWYKITIFDADWKTPKWEIATSQDIDAVLVVDMDQDGRPEIVYGDRQGGAIHVIDAATHLQKLVIYNSNAGVAGIAVGDVDKDGNKEILWGAGWYSTAADYLIIADAKTGTTKWKSVHVDGPLSAVDVGDVDGDGDDEIVMVSFESESGYKEGIIHIFDAKTHTLEYREKLGIMDWMGVRSVRIGDVDGDGKNEFVVTTANIYDGIIRVYDGTTRALKYSSAGYNGSFFSVLAIADVDNDGKLEIVAGQGREHTGATGTYLIVFDGKTLQEKWRSVDLGLGWGSVRDLKVADIDGDGNKEIIAANGTQLVIYDGVTHILKFQGNQSANAVEVVNNELLVGREDGKIDVIDGATFAVKKTVTTSSTSKIDALRAIDLNSDGAPEWVLAHGGTLEILQGTTQAPKWISPTLSPSLGLFNHLVVRDTDGDGRKEIIAGDTISLYHFEQNP